MEFVLQVWDTAHETKNNNDYSACLTWGVWYNEESHRHELMLLNAIRNRWEFPQLKEIVLEQYKEWEPECLLVEKKAAGAPLIQELRQMDIGVEEYSPSRGAAGVSNDKRARVNSVSPLLFDGVVWAPDFRWAHEVINECAEFPNGEHDDYVDCVTMALSRYRRGGFISLKSDRQDEPKIFRRSRQAAYY
jgi:predicted phage terminase large subunit-like protein